MKTIKSFALALGVVAGAGIVTSCSNEEYKFDEHYAQKVAESEYRTNFEKTFGAIAPDQGWDFTSGSTFYLASMSNRATRGVTSYNPTVGDYYNVQKETLTWLTNKIKEGSDNRKLGSPFAMTVPSNSFTIVPIYQGQASMSWDLHMVVGTGEDAVDTKIWTKSQGIQTSKTGKNNSWSNLSTSGNTLSAAYVRSLQYTFDNMPVGETIYFYLEVTAGSSGYATKGTKQSSLGGMMLALDDCPRPNNIAEQNEVMVIGCEDADLKNSDWDMNDVVFLVIGNPDVPKPIEILDDQVIEKQEKRYMIEDLGVTDDFDFNDIVVDVKAERTVNYHIENGVLKSTTYGDWKQQATLKHLGGTIPFTLTIGNTVIKDHAPGLDVDINEVHEITGWDPEANNISVSVRNLSNTAIYNINFPKPGDAPLIIATDTKQNWMKERVNINWLQDELNVMK